MKNSNETKDEQPSNQHSDQLCSNCYFHGMSCLNCIENDYGIAWMEWYEFHSQCQSSEYLHKFGKIPASYKEFSELSDLFNDLPCLIMDSDSDSDSDSDIY